MTQQSKLYSSPIAAYADTSLNNPVWVSISYGLIFTSLGLSVFNSPCLQYEASVSFLLLRIFHHDVRWCSQATFILAKSFGTSSNHPAFSICLHCCNIIPQTGQLKQQKCFLYFWRLESKMKVPADSAPRENPLPGLQTAPFSICSHVVFPQCIGVEKQNALSSFIRPLICHVDPPSWAHPNQIISPKACLQIPS